MKHMIDEDTIAKRMGWQVVGHRKAMKEIRELLSLIDRAETKFILKIGKDYPFQVTYEDNKFMAANSIEELTSFIHGYEQANKKV